MFVQQLKDIRMVHEDEAGETVKFCESETAFYFFMFFFPHRVHFSYEQYKGVFSMF